MECGITAQIRTGRQDSPVWPWVKSPTVSQLFSHLPNGDGVWVLLGILFILQMVFKVLKKLIHAKHSEKLFLLLLHYYFIICFSFFFWPCHVACSILVPLIRDQNGQLWEMVGDREVRQLQSMGHRVGQLGWTEQQQRLNPVEAWILNMDW